jgi:hypothetical protein
MISGEEFAVGWSREAELRGNLTVCEEGNQEGRSGSRSCSVGHEIKRKARTVAHGRSETSLWACTTSREVAAKRGRQAHLTTRKDLFRLAWMFVE